MAFAIIIPLAIVAVWISYRIGRLEDQMGIKD